MPNTEEQLHKVHDEIAINAMKTVYGEQGAQEILQRTRYHLEHPELAVQAAQENKTVTTLMQNAQEYALYHESELDALPAYYDDHTSAFMLQYQKSKNRSKHARNKLKSGMKANDKKQLLYRKAQPAGSVGDVMANGNTELTMEAVRQQVAARVDQELQPKGEVLVRKDVTGQKRRHHINKYKHLDEKKLKAKADELNRDAEILLRNIEIDQQTFRRADDHLVNPATQTAVNATKALPVLDQELADLRSELKLKQQELDDWNAEPEEKQAENKLRSKSINGGIQQLQRQIANLESFQTSLNQVMTEFVPQLEYYQLKTRAARRATAVVSWDTSPQYVVEASELSDYGGALTEILSNKYHEMQGQMKNFQKKIQNPNEDRPWFGTAIQELSRLLVEMQEKVKKRPQKPFTLDEPAPEEENTEQKEYYQEVQRILRVLSRMEPGQPANNNPAQ